MSSDEIHGPKEELIEERMLTHYSSCKIFCHSNLQFCQELILRLSTMDIFIKTVHDQVTTLKVDPFDVAQNIKALIEHKIDIPLQEQVFVFAGKEVDNWKCLYNCKIFQSNTINLTWNHLGNIKIFIKTFIGKTIIVHVTPEDTILRIKAKIWYQEGIINEVQRLFLKGR